MDMLIPKSCVYVARVYNCGPFMWQAAYYDKDGMRHDSELSQFRNKAITHAQLLSKKYDASVYADPIKVANP